MNTYKFTGKHDSYYSCRGRLLVGITKRRITGIWYSEDKTRREDRQWMDVWCDKRKHGIHGSVKWYYYD